MKQLSRYLAAVFLGLFGVVYPLPSLSGAAGPLTVAQVGSVTTGHLARVASVDLRNVPTGSSARPPSNRYRPRRYPYASQEQHRAQSEAAATTSAAPRAAGSNIAPSVVSTSIVSNFEGLTTSDTAATNGIDLEPPDQGLCVGPPGVVEEVNLAIAAYSPAGVKLAGPYSLNALFSESLLETLSDPRCYYDPRSQTWFFTVLAMNVLQNNESHLDVAVDHSPTLGAPLMVYRFPTTDSGDPGCPCFGDQPLLGVDATGVYVSTNEFALVGSAFNGAQVYAIDKAQLVSGAASPFFAHYGSLSNGGVQAASMQPAITPGSSPAEYFLDSLDPSGTVDNRLGVWAMSNEGALDSGTAPTLTGTVITVEPYGLPPNAAQKGSTAQLSPDDDRMQQVQNVGGTLWGTLDTVARTSGDTANRDGIAWFQIVPTLAGNGTISGASVAAQGYVAASGYYLLYPAVAVNDIGDAAMVFTISGSAIYPSVAYVTGPSFSTGVVAVLGSAPDHGFSCSPCRWGDYSAAVWSSVPAGSRLPDLWLASEYIAGTGDALANWATRVFEVVPQGG